MSTSRSPGAEGPEAEAISSPRPGSAAGPWNEDARGEAVAPATQARAARGGEHPALASYTRWPGASLLGALKRLTRAEDLQGAAWQCAACGARGRGATKRLTLAALPPLLVLHAKRFEHPGGFEKGGVRGTIHGGKGGTEGEGRALKGAGTRRPRVADRMCTRAVCSRRALPASEPRASPALRPHTITCAPKPFQAA